MVHKLKRMIKRILKRILTTLKLYDPVAAAWRGYQEWKFFQKAKNEQKEKDEQTEINVSTRNRHALKLAEQVTACIKKIDLSNKKGIVYIFQHGYFTTDGKVYISGGGERYATDLSYLIDSLGYQSVLVQVGDENAKEPWVKWYGKNYVIGRNGWK